VWCIYRYSREAIYFGAPETLDGNPGVGDDLL